MMMRKNYILCLVALAVAQGCNLLVQGHAQAAIVYNAGADLLANEQPNNANEVLNPNYTVPEWSYGFRSTTLGPGLTLFTNHVNGSLGVLDGFNDPNSICCGALPNVFVNTGAATGFPDGSVATGEITMHPDGDAGFPNSIEEKPVVRFTATLSGNYQLNALFEDIDDCCGGAGAGVDVHVVHNGLSLFDASISREGADALPDGTTFSTLLFLASGDTLDFVVGTNGQLFGDNTRFNAILEYLPAPEPSTAVLLCLGTLFLAGRRQRN